jgi:transposase-like protein
LIFDGTYFKHENCLLLLLDSQASKAISCRYQVRENYAAAYEMFQRAKKRGVNPVAITIDGNTSVIRAIKNVWPDIIIQRCLVHIQRQGLSWLRRYPKLEASKELRKVYLTIFRIENSLQRNAFFNDLLRWEKRYGQQVASLPSSDKVYGDLQRAISLLLNAWPDMFHYLNDCNIAPTTNLIEGYFSIIKSKYKQHHGLSKMNRQKYLKWYVYLKNNS